MAVSGKELRRRRRFKAVQAGRRRRVSVRWYVAGLTGAAAVSLGAFTVSLQHTTAGPRTDRAAHLAPAQGTRALAAEAARVYPTLPGIGARFRSQLPPETSQVLVAYGDGPDRYTTTTALFEKVADGWRLADTWRGHNGYDGWTEHKATGDLKSPIGMFPLTDAGGHLPEPPGTHLPYQQSERYADNGQGFFGESLGDVFDYVIAIDYNHVAGTTPLDTDYPLGPGAGTGIWLHVDHGGPTHACVSIPQRGMETLLKTLDPADHPVIIMGDRADLASA